MFYELLNLAIRNMMRARARLAMTAGGVMIGTASVVLLIALTQGLQTAAESSIGDDATLTQVTITASFRRNDTSPPLDAEAMTQLTELDGVAMVIPMLQLDGQVELVDGNLAGAAQVFGIFPDTFEAFGLNAESGELSLTGVTNYVAVVGQSITENFVDEDADEYIPTTVDVMSTEIELAMFSQNSSREVPLEINGIFEAGTAYDFYVFMPIETVLDLNERLSGVDVDMDELVYDRVIVQATDRTTAGDVMNTILDLGYNASGSGSMLSELNSFFGTMGLMLAGVGGVALLVAAFGVANTMTMAILERTREIGLMKAIGATDENVLTIFLVEAGLVGLVGGLSGLGISFTFQYLLNQVLTNLSNSTVEIDFLPVDVSTLGDTVISIPTDLAIGAVVLATCIGVSAGLYPAFRAARMIPVLALKTD